MGMPDDNCGYELDDGTPCQRDAGWGTDSTIGHCKDHAQEWTIPQKLDEETINTLVGAAQSGAFKKHCAQVAGITPQTLRSWLAEGEDHAERDLDTALADLHLRFTRARAASAVQKLQNADDEFVLERSYGYIRQERKEHLVDEDADLDRDVVVDFEDVDT